MLSHMKLNTWCKQARKAWYALFFFSFRVFQQHCLITIVLISHRTLCRGRTSHVLSYMIIMNMMLLKGLVENQLVMSDDVLLVK